MFNAFSKSVLTLTLLLFINTLQAQINYSYGTSLSYARVGHTSQVLDDGRVFVIGGNDGNYANLNAYKGSRFYDPQTNLWTSGPSMTYERYDLFSIKLNDGRILAIGGKTESGNTLYGSEIYDPKTDQWTIASTVGGYLNGDCIKMNDGRIMFGGGVGLSNNVKCYNPESGNWGALAKMNHDHGQGMKLTLLNSGKILATGGKKEWQKAELYDPVMDTWKDLPHLNEQREFHNTILMENGNVLIAGGTFQKTSEYFDVVQESFIALPDFFIASAGNDLIELDNGDILMHGIGDVLDPTNTKCFQIYKPSTKTWSTIITNIIGATGYQIQKLRNGKIIIIGGIATTGNGASKQVLLLNQEGFDGCSPAKLNLELIGSSDCFGVNQLATIKNSEIGVAYQVSTGGVKIGNAINGTGGDLAISFTEEIIAFGENMYNILASKNGCITLPLDTTLNISTNYAFEDKPELQNTENILCLGDSLKLVAIHNSYGRFEWHNGVNDSVNYQKIDEPVSARVIDQRGCKGPFSNSVSISKYSRTDVSAGESLEICYNTDTVVYLEGIPENGVWSGEGVTEEGLFNSNISVGSYRLTYDACGYSKTTTVNIRKNEIPSYDFDNIHWSNVDTLCGGMWTDIRFDSTYSREKFLIYGDGVLLEEFRGVNYGNKYYYDYKTDSTVNYDILVVPSYPYDVCVIDTLLTQKTLISVPVPNNNKEIIYPDSVCRNDSFEIKIVNPDNNVFYRFDNYNEIFSTGQDTLVFKAKMLSKYGHGYSIEAENMRRCGRATDIGYIQVKPKLPIANFTNDELYFVGDTVAITNTSNVPISNWDINGVKTTNTHPDKIVYSSTGKQNYTLIASVNAECSDTISKEILIVSEPNSFPNNKGLFDTLEIKTDYGYEVYQTHTDKDGFLYSIGSNYYHECGTGYQDCSNWFIEKYDSEGKNVWSREEYHRNYQHWSDYYSTFFTGIDSDDEGNLYLTGSYTTNYIDIGAVTLDHTDAIKPRAFVMKMDSDGEILWFKYSYSAFGEYRGGRETGGANVKVIGNKIYFSIAVGESMKGLDGQDIGAYEQTTNRIMEFSKDGILLNEYFLEETPPFSGSTGLLFNFNSNSSAYDSRVVATVGPIMSQISNNKIAVTGFMNNGLSFDNLEALIPEGEYYSQFMAILNIETGLWENAFTVGTVKAVRNIQDKPIIVGDNNGNIVTAFSTHYDYSGDESYLISPNGTKYTYNNDEFTYFTSVSQTGTIVWEKILKNSMIRTLDYDTASNSIIIYGKSKKGLTFGLSGEEFGLKGSDDYDNFVASFDASSGAINWFEKINSNNGDIPHYAHLDNCGNYNVFGGFDRFANGATSVNFMSETLTIDGAQNYLIRVPIAQLDLNSDCSSTITSIRNQSDLDFSDLMYPNPTSGLIQLKIADDIQTIKVFDQIGKKVLSSEGKRTVNLESLSAGNYFIKIVTTNHNVFSRKIILVK